ncbi:MAG: hypothetical protein K8I27_07070 [Planctomycetes bacterium]|nr:hypothetical protein [Planctomycetota bacterium]
MKTYLVAWAGDRPGAQFVRALGAADACLRIDFVPSFLVSCGDHTWTGRDAWTQEALAVVLVDLDTVLDLDLTETIAVLATSRGRVSR